LSYRADIAVLADSQSDAGSRHGDTFSADPSYWLLQPDVPDQAGYSITVHLPERWGLSAPWRDVVRNGDSISAFIPATPRDWSASVVFGELEEHRIDLPGGLLRVAYVGASPDAQTAAMLERCIRTAAESVARVAGRLPVPEVRVLILPVSKLSVAFRFAAWLDGGAVLGGESARGQGNSLELVVDPRRPESEFRRDWTTFHELSHLLHPYLGDRGAWLTEGLATYYQTVLRVRAGRMTQSEAWQRMIEGFDEVATNAGDTRLEDVAASMQESHRFDYVYRSGALFWLTVDVELRRASHGRHSLDAALAAFHTCCLPSYREWEPREYVARLDRGLDAKVFARRFDEFRALTHFPEWRNLFARLGIVRNGTTITFDAAAPDARIREAIMAPAVVAP
jgi:hypothetical protein